MGRAMASSPFRGVTRREFLGYCGAVCVALGLGEAAVPELAMALERLAKRPNVLWSCFGECLGCSVSLLQNTSPRIPRLILQTISLDYHEAVMAPAGFQAEKSLRQTLDAGGFYWVAEGAIPTTPPEACMIAGKTAAQLAPEIYRKAKASIAIGSCATNGNVQASKPDPTGALGVLEYLKTAGGIPDAVMINMPRCPGNGDDLVLALSYVLLTGKPPELDAQYRPVMLYGQTVHDDCERRAHFEAGEFVEDYGDPHWAQGWCLFKMGCRGPVTYAPCPRTRWNDRVSWCVHNGPCTGCAEAGFWDKYTPFTAPLHDVQVPGVGAIDATTLGLAITGATAAGLAIHFVGQVATGRAGHGGPDEAADEAAHVEPAAPTAREDAPGDRPDTPEGGDA